MWKNDQYVTEIEYGNRALGFIGLMQYLVFGILVILHLLCLCSAFVKNTTLPCVKALSHYCQKLSHLRAVFLCNLSSPEKTLPFNVGWIFSPDGQRLEIGREWRGTKGHLHALLACKTAATNGEMLLYRLFVIPAHRCP